MVHSIVPMLLAALVLPLTSAAAEETASPPPTAPPASAPAPPTAPPAAASPPVQETTIHGTPPDLTGRWLAVSWLEIAGGQSTITALFEIGKADDKQNITQRFADLPSAQSAAIEKAREKQARWEPTARDLAEINAAWAELPTSEAHLGHMSHDLVGRDGMDDVLKKEERTKNAIWVLRQRQDSDSTGRVMRQVFIYAAQAPSEDGYTGTIDGAMIAAAPFPVPISFKGNFRFYRVDARPGLIARFLGLFQGCGRGETH